MEKAARIIRKLTLPPILTGGMLAVLLFWRPEVFQSGLQFGYTWFFLVMFPVLAYPLQWYLPCFRDKGRERQRNLEMAFSFLGCLGECLFHLAFPASDGLLLISWTYLLSGAFLLFLNQVLFKASGHAAGAAAAGILPILLGLNRAAPFSVMLLVLIYDSSLYLKRHTLQELLGGTLIPILCALAIYPVL